MKYIITDPCYIMNDIQYEKICKEDNCDFEGQKFPLNSILANTASTKIIFHKIEGTPHGDGSYLYRDQDIGVDAGMLCIAEMVEGDWKEQFGAIFPNLAAALKAFPDIIKHF